MERLFRRIRIVISWAMAVLMLPWSSFVYNTTVYAEDETGVTTYTYDNLGNQLTVTDNSGTVKREYDRFNRVISVIDSNGKIIKYSYDELGNILSLTYPGGEIVRYEYNPDASLSSVIDGKGRKTTYEYDRAGRISKITRPDGTIDEKTYDASGNLSKEVQKKQNGDLLQSFEYRYDSLGNIILVRDNIGLDKADYSGEALSDNAEDNSLSSGSTTSIMEYDECNRLISFNGQEVLYDANGNMTYGPLNGKMTEFVYDCRNRLIKAGDISYTYDADNVRTSVITPDYEETYVVDRVNSPTETLQIIRKSLEETETINYYYGLGLLYSSSTDGISVYHFDHNGSTRKITDETGNLMYTVQYGTYGEILSIRDVLKNIDISINELNESIICRFLYNGEYGVITDDNTLMYMRQRYYNPDIKRFINMDILTGDVTVSQSLNRYAYVQGNPVNYNDPFGLSPKEILTDAAKVASQVVHSELNLMGLIPGLSGSVACLLNAVLYLREGNNFMAGVSAVQAGATLFGGRIISSGVGYFCKFGTGSRIALSVGMTGGGAFLTLASYSNLLTDLNNYTSAVKNGADVSTQFTYLSRIIIDAAGVYYGAMTMAGGVNGLTSQCFVEGTDVKTENGDKNIKDIQAGDRVWSFDPETGETGLKEVKEVFVNETYELEHISLVQYEYENEEVKIVCTPEHPFYVVDYGFKYASELKVGDKIKSLSGDIYEVKDIYDEVLSEPIKVYNFEVEDWHTYYVTENGIPVHNMCAMKTTTTTTTTQTTSASGSSEGGSESYNSFRDLMSPEEAQRYDKYWQRNAPDYNTPNSRLKIYKEHNGVIEESTVVYDNAGRQKYRVDYTNHGRSDHSNPHLHEYIFGPGYDSIKGMEIRYDFD